MLRVMAALGLVGAVLVSAGASHADGASEAARGVGGAHPEAPPAAHTGGFGEPSCLACHNEYAPNLPGGSLAVEGVPREWTSGRTYTLTVVLESEGTGAAGFQLALRDNDGSPAGSVAGTTPHVGVTTRTGADSAGVFVHHTRQGSVVEDPNRATWRFTWTAPAEPGTGAVVLHAAANSGNGDNSPFGDLVYLYEVRIPETAPGAAPSRTDAGRRRPAHASVGRRSDGPPALSTRCRRSRSSRSGFPRRRCRHRRSPRTERCRPHGPTRSRSR